MKRKKATRASKTSRKRLIAPLQSKPLGAPNGDPTDARIRQMILRDLRAQLRKLMPRPCDLKKSPVLSDPAQLLLLQRSIAATRASTEKDLEKQDAVLVAIESLEAKMRPTRRMVLKSRPAILEEGRTVTAAFLEALRGQPKRVPGSCFEFFSRKAQLELRRVAINTVRFWLGILHLSAAQKRLPAGAWQSLIVESIFDALELPPLQQLRSIISDLRSVSALTVLECRTIETQIEESLLPEVPTQNPNAVPPIERMRKAIAEVPNGKNAKPDVLLAHAKIARQAGRQALRELETLREYDGFDRQIPARYRP